MIGERVDRRSDAVVETVASPEQVRLAVAKVCLAVANSGSVALWKREAPKGNAVEDASHEEIDGHVDEDYKDDDNDGIPDHKDKDHHSHDEM